MSVFRIWQLAQFELTRLFATKRGLLALAAFAMVWVMILKYPIGHAIPFLSSPQFSDIAKQLAGTVGLSHLVSWPEAEMAIYWIIALYSFPTFSLFVSSDQTVGDRVRGTLRFISLRSTREEILLGRFFGQLIIIAILIATTVLATIAVMGYRDTSLIASGFGLGIKITLQLVVIVAPFIALMAFLNLVASSSRLSIVLAILIFTLGNAIIAYAASYISVIEKLFYLFPGVQLTDVAPQQHTQLIDWLTPILQSIALLGASAVVLRRRAL